MTNFVLVPAARSTPTKQAPGQLANRKPSGQRDYILLDRSASMLERWEAALGAVNTYARTLANSKVNTKITVAVFDDQYEIIWRDVAPSVCTPITSKNVNPRGRTALNDAIGRIVLQAKTDNSEKAAIVIMTDGEENSSRELTQGHAAGLLAECRLRGWQIIFLGIDHDNTELARRYGAAPAEFIATGKESIAALMANVAEKRTTHGQTGQRIAFTDAEKQDARLLLR
jgi:Mg-chelatase subunit ChlD